MTFILVLFMTVGAPVVIIEPGDKVRCEQRAAEEKAKASLFVDHFCGVKKHGR